LQDYKYIYINGLLLEILGETRKDLRVKYILLKNGNMFERRNYTYTLDKQAFSKLIQQSSKYNSVEEFKIEVL